MEAVNTISAEKNKAYEGRVEQVLVEGISKNDETAYTGRTEGFKLINFPGSADLLGKIIDVKVTAGKTFSLEGQVL